MDIKKSNFFSHSVGENTVQINNLIKSYAHCLAYIYNGNSDYLSKNDLSQSDLSANDFKDIFEGILLIRGLRKFSTVDFDSEFNTLLNKESLNNLLNEEGCHEVDEYIRGICGNILCDTKIFCDIYFQIGSHKHDAICEYINNMSPKQ